MASRVLRDQLIGLVDSYLRNVKLFAAFEKVCLDLAWDSHLLRHEVLDDLVVDVEHAVIEYKAGLLDEEALRAGLADMSRSVSAKRALREGNGALVAPLRKPQPSVQPHARRQYRS